MRSDLLSKRLFYAGCFGLPWLWAVHVLYHYSNGSDSGLINPDDHFEDGAPVSAAFIQTNTEKYVAYSKVGASVCGIFFVAWIFVAQIFRGVLPAELYLLNGDNVALTGW